MTVRAKMSANSVSRGARGALVYMSCVYEGSSELQKISENAIFGDATPNGSLSVEGEFNPEAFRPEPQGMPREFYIDLMPPGAGAQRPKDGDAIALRVPVRKTFQGDPSQMQPSGTTFRFVSDGPITAHLDMYIVNPAAIDALAAVDRADMVVHAANGRRSDAEIAVLEKMVTDEEASARNFHKDKSPEALAETVRTCTYHTRRKLALARGEAFTERYTAS